MRILDAASGLFVTFLVAQAVLPDLGTRVAVGRQAETKEFSIVAQRYEFVPDHIEVETGDHVRITVRSIDGTHGFSIRGLGIREEVPRTGEPVTVDFEATRPGDFEITCSEYCGHGHSAMRGMLIVRPTTDQGKAR
jgi:heme/copper-type cytochrome/quinol oxidase subunit 2